MIILVLNCGSSSIKYQLFNMDDSAEVIAKGMVERIGFTDAVISHKPAGKTKHIQDDMGRLISMLPPTEGRAVVRLREKLDQAVVHHHEGACQGCFHQLPQQQALSVDSGRSIVRCPSCMRFLVHRSWR